MLVCRCLYCTIAAKQPTPNATTHLDLLTSASRALWLWLLRLVIVDAALWVLCAALAMLQPASRRACNLTYMVWILALSLLLLLALAAADFVSRGWELPGTEVRPPAPLAAFPSSVLHGLVCS